CARRIYYDYPLDYW
nr:immunoglobulin heavy chain junction region [Mus musculus]